MKSAECFIMQSVTKVSGVFVVMWGSLDWLQVDHWVTFDLESLINLHAHLWSVGGD